MATHSGYKSLSANDLFKAQYPKVMRWATLSAFVLMAVIFLFSPRYVPNPYRLYRTEMQVTDIQEQVEVPPPPEEVRRPQQVEIEAAPDEEVDEDVEIADTLLGAEDALDFGDMGMGDMGDDFVVSQEKPKLTHYQQPDYPEMARASQLEGTVVVKVLVGPDGAVRQAVVIQSVHPLLDRAAREAALRCRFSPGKQRGIAVKAWMAIPFVFGLN